MTARVTQLAMASETRVVYCRSCIRAQSGQLQYFLEIIIRSALIYIII